MADGSGFNAGAIFVSLQAQLTEFNAGIESAKKTLDSLGSSGTTTATALQETGTAVSTALDRMNTAVPKAARYFNDLQNETGKVRTNFQETAKSTDSLGQATERSNASFGRSANRILGVQLALPFLALHVIGKLQFGDGVNELLTVTCPKEF